MFLVSCFASSNFHCWEKGTSQTWSKKRPYTTLWWNGCNVWMWVLCVHIEMLRMLNIIKFCLSDIIVVWRAWTLSPGKRTIQWVLGVLMGITLGKITSLHKQDEFAMTEIRVTVCNTVNGALITVQDLHLNPASNSYSGPVYPSRALAALLYIPLVTTNLVATTVICFRAWYIVLREVSAQMHAYTCF